MLNMIIISAILFVAIDSIYLNLMKNYFNHQVIKVQGSSVRFNYIAAIITYIFLIYALYYFILSKNKSVTDAFILGVVIYGVYEFTNLTILKEWKLKSALIDTLWGGILFSLTTFLTHKIKKFYKFL